MPPPENSGAGAGRQSMAEFLASWEEDLNALEFRDAHEEARFCHLLGVFLFQNLPVETLRLMWETLDQTPASARAAIRAAAAVRSASTVRQYPVLASSALVYLPDGSSYLPPQNLASPVRILDGPLLVSNDTLTNGLARLNWSRSEYARRMDLITVDTLMDSLGTMFPTFYTLNHHHSASGSKVGQLFAHSQSLLATYDIAASTKWATASPTTTRILRIRIRSYILEQWPRFRLDEKVWGIQGDELWDSNECRERE